MKNTLILAGALGAALTLSMNNLAMSRPSEDMAFNASHIVSHLSDRLDLSDEQQAGIETALAAGAEQTALDRERLRELKQLLQAQVADFDAGKTQTLADEIGQLSTRMSYNRTAAFAQAYQLLDKEQRAQLDALLEERGARRSKWQRRHGGDYD